MEERRTTFRASLAVDRRATPAAISAVGIDPSGQRLFLGLEDGGLEEYSLVQEGGAVSASLVARKQPASKAITAIHDVSSFNCLVVASADGHVCLLGSQTLDGVTLPIRHATATCVSVPPGRLPRLAVAQRLGKRALRLVVYQLQPTPQGPRAVLLAQADVPAEHDVAGMAWVGPHVVLSSGAKYLLVAPRNQGSQWRELFEVPEDLAQAPALVHPLRDVGRALLTVGPAGIIVDAAGNPVGSALRLDGLMAPRALASAAGFVLVVCEGGIHIFEQASGQEVQVLAWPWGQHPAPGQPLFAADSLGPAGCVAVAGRQKAWVCCPVAPEEQAQELLGRREYGKALELVQAGLQRGAAWAEEAVAQAGLLLLHDCRFDEAVACLERCSPACFQPAQLFPLFPAYTAPWEGEAPAPRSYWGLHQPLHSLAALLEPKLVHLQAGPGGSTSGRAPADGSFGPHGSAAQQQAAVQNGIAAAAAVAAQGGSSGDSGGKAAAAGHEQRRLEHAARQCVVQYLFRVRALEGVACLDGLDTLLMHLLLDSGAAREAVAFAAVPNQVAADAVAPRLEAAGWRHALATLWAARGRAEEALCMWQQVVEGSGSVPGGAAASPKHAAAERPEALESAAALLADPAACSDTLLLRYTPWLLAASQPAALRVLRARRLAPEAVLPLLPPGSEARWQYLAHLVGEGGSVDAALHTELATQLAAAILSADPQLRHAGAQPPPRAATRRSSSSSRRGSAAASVAALVSGGNCDVGAAGGAVEALRLRLRLHLEHSDLVDPHAVLRCVEGTALHEELVVLHSKMGDHMAALRVLALTLRDVAAAEAYATAHLPPSDYRALLHLVLSPGEGVEPLWEDACYLISALGDHLDPAEVVEALPPGMPLAAAAAVMAPVLRDRVHRRRQGQVVRSLHRSRLSAAREARADAEGQRVSMGEERACPQCHLRLGGKVFVVVQPAAAVAAQQGGGREGGGLAWRRSSSAQAARQLAAAGGELQVVCYNCHRRLTEQAEEQPSPTSTALSLS